jgi:VCBS repeat-containing protein
MVDITANITVTDACDAQPTVKLVSITSNEPVNGTGDGNTSPDIAGATFGTDDRTFQLRAERKGNGNGRVYTVSYSAQDASGNTAQQIVTVTVAHDQGVSDYTVDAFPTSATIKQGQSATFTLTVTPTNGFNQTVAFVCTGLPAGASCSFAPATVTPNGGPVTTTLTVTTMAPSIHSRLYGPSNWLWAQGGTFAIAVFLVPGVLRRNGNRRKRFAVIMMLLVVVSLIITYGGGCSSSGTNSGGGTSNVGTPLGTSKVTVSSTAGPSSSASQHGISISITITQ